MLHFIFWECLPAIELIIRIISGIVFMIVGLKLNRILSACDKWELMEDENEKN